MSWHCLFCGNPDHWVRGRERENICGFIEIFISDGFNGKKISLGVAHADCFQRILKMGQRKYLSNGELFNFEELSNFIKRGD